METRYYMMAETGAVDTKESWICEFGEDVLKDLVEVVPADPSFDEESFSSCESYKLNWVEI